MKTIDKYIYLIISKSYHSRILGTIFPTLVSCLQKELKDCHSVLDLGCGPSSPLQYCQVKHSVGVDAFKPYIETSKKSNIHTTYILSDIANLRFKPKSFDAIIMIDVLEHLDKKIGNKILRRINNWAKKKIIINTPNGYCQQPAVDKNPFQQHKSGWGLKELTKKNYHAHGLAGLNFLRTNNPTKNEVEKRQLTQAIKFKPKLLWFIVAVISQIAIYHIPKYAYEIFYVKNKSKPTYE
jgi:SAM-dependent methyltransferase